MHLPLPPAALRSAWLLFAVPFAATSLHAQVAVPVGTRVPVASTAAFSSKTAKKGDVIPMTVVSDVSVDGHVIIPKGTAVKGRVADAKKAGRFGKSGKLELTVDSLPLTDGQKLALYADLDDTTTVATDAGGNAVENAVKDKASSVVNAIPGAGIATGFMHKGDDVSFKEGQVIPVFSFSYVAVNIPGATSAPPPTPAAAAADTATRPVTSTDTTGASAPASSDATAEVSIAPAAIGLFDATHTWARALATLAAHVSASPVVRATGQQIIAQDSALQVKGAALAASAHTTVPPLDAETQTKLNGLLRALQATPDDKFDATIMQQLYEVQSNFVDNIDPEDESPMGKLLVEAAPVWKGQMEMVAKLIVPPGGAGH